MTQSQDEDNNAYTHLILGTSLMHCILSASLHQSSTSNKILQVDSNDYYGGENASLALSQLESYLGSLPSTSRARVTFPAFEATGSGDGLPPQLKGLDRHYSLSLTPALLAAHGPALDALVRSKVAEYATFRLLQRTAVYTPEDGEESAAASSSSSTLRPVPSSKEDVFKTPTSVLSLLDKRKLMKLLQWCATAQLGSSSGDSEDATLSSALTSLDLWSFLTGGNQRLSPSLASAIAYGLCLSPDAHTEPAIPALRRLQTHLRSTGKYGNAAYLVAQYGGAGELVQGYARAAAVRGATFVLGKGVERCEASGSGKTGEDRRRYFDVRLKDVDETFRCEKVVGSRRELEKLGLVQPREAAASARGGKAALQGLLLLDRGIQMPSPADAASSSSSSTSDTPQEAPSPIETALIVFPPQSLSLASGKKNAVTVTALVLGEGTFCCPKGQYVVHLTATGLGEGDVEAAEELFEAAKRAVLGLARESPVEWKPAAKAAEDEVEQKAEEAPKDTSDDFVPLMEAFWLSSADEDGGEEAIEVVSASGAADSTLRPPSTISSDAATSDTPPLLSTILDSSTQRAESLFYLLHGLTPEQAATAAATRRSSRRRRRDAAEYRGRGGAGPEDEEEKEGEEEEEGQDGDEEQEEVPLFFGGERRRGGDDDDEDEEEG